MSIAGLKRISKSPEETVVIGKEIAKLLPNRGVVCLTGDLGAGKTTLVKGIASAITNLPSHEINSPTFTYLNIYDGEKPLYHIDCYRMKSEIEFIHHGLEEYLEELCLIEWPERIPSLLPSDSIQITIHYLRRNEREIILKIL